MRSIAAAFLGIAFAAGMSYAHGSRTETADRLAGTLTCVTKPELSLVFGRSPFATCTFLSKHTNIREDYHAVLAASDPAAQVDSSQKIVWRVWTRHGTGRRAMLRGAFLPVTASADRDHHTFAGRSTSLKIVSHSRRGIATFAHSYARIDLAAVDS